MFLHASTGRKPLRRLSNMSRADKRLTKILWKCLIITDPILRDRYFEGPGYSSILYIYLDLILNLDEIVVVVGDLIDNSIHHALRVV